MTSPTKPHEAALIAAADQALQATRNRRQLLADRAARMAGDGADATVIASHLVSRLVDEAHTYTDPAQAAYDLAKLAAIAIADAAACPERTPSR